MVLAYENFRVRGGVMRTNGTVAAAANDFALANNDGAHGDFAGHCPFARQGQRLAHH